MYKLLHHIVRVSLMGILALSLCHCSSAPKSDSTVGAGAGAGSGTGPGSGSSSGSDSGAASDNSSGSGSGAGSGSQPAGDTGTNTDPNAVSLTAADWDIISNGEGTVTFDADGILMTPKAATASDVTHAIWLLAKSTESKLLQNFKATIKYTNIAQLRTGSEPNGWEVFWLFFNYTVDGVGKKVTNYATIKPSGTEVGRAFDEKGQEFLVTNGTPTLQIGTTHTITVTKNGTNVKVLHDGVVAADFTSEVAPSAKYIYDVPGSIGLYCEDAQVRVSSVVIEALP